MPVFARYYFANTVVRCSFIERVDGVPAANASERAIRGADKMQFSRELNALNIEFEPCKI